MSQEELHINFTLREKTCKNVGERLITTAVENLPEEIRRKVHTSLFDEAHSLQYFWHHPPKKLIIFIEQPFKRFGRDSIKSIQDLRTTGNNVIPVIFIHRKMADSIVWLEEDDPVAPINLWYTCQEEDIEPVDYERTPRMISFVRDNIARLTQDKKPKA